MNSEKRDPWFDRKGFDLHENVLQSSSHRLNELSPDNQFTQKHWVEQRKLIFELLKQFESNLNNSEHRDLTKILIEYETLLHVTDKMQDDVPWQEELF